MKRLRESVLVDAVATFLLQGGGSIFREVPTLGQSADLVLAREQELMFVEVKVNAVRRAIEQCKAHELVADFICIAVGTQSISEENFARIASAGYGLISCSDPERGCTWILHPRRQNSIWKPVRDKVYQRMIEEEACLPSIG